eukprot:m.154023 g.154023  ORF g.154023 m.154023 type:complete len:410 (+) comp23486_c0_seq1:46-1275(+)
MGDVGAVASASSKLEAGLITREEFRHILKVAGSADSSAAMSREKNPFSFNNFASDSDGASPAVACTPPTNGTTKTKDRKIKGERKKVKKKKSVAAADDDVDIFAEPTKPAEPNPFSFKAYDTTSPPADVPRAQQAPPLPSAHVSAPLSRSSSNGPLQPAVTTTNDSDMSSSESDGSDNAGPRLPSAADDDEDSWDSEDNDDSATLPRPKPQGVVTAAAGANIGGGNEGGIIARVKRRVTLLKQQLHAANEELRMSNEQHDMDMEDLRDENRTLRKEVKQLRAAANKAEKKASAASSQLRRRTEDEQKEAAVLEDFTQRVEQNLEQTTKRAVEAEAQVAKLREDLKKYKGMDLSQGAMNQIKSASLQLKTLSQTSEKSLQDLIAGAKTLTYVSEILSCAEKLAEVDSDSG